MFKALMKSHCAPLATFALILTCTRSQGKLFLMSRDLMGHRWERYRKRDREMKLIEEKATGGGGEKEVMKRGDVHCCD